MAEAIQFLKAYASYAAHRGRHKRLAVLGSFLAITLIHSAKLPRRRIRLLGAPFEFPDALSMRMLVDELIVKHVYSVWPPARESPLIIDAGANIGVATLYFKRLFPRSRVIAIEPDPNSADYLRRNAGDLGSVEIVEAAITGTDGPRWLLPSNTLGNVSGDQTPESLAVQTVQLESIVTQGETIDIFKLDVEGAELEVLRTAPLDRIEQLVAEVHIYEGRPDPLPSILRLLSDAGRHYTVSHWSRGPADATCVVHSWRSGGTRRGEIALFV